MLGFRPPDLPLECTPMYVEALMALLTFVLGARCLGLRALGFRYFIFCGD